MKYNPNIHHRKSIRLKEYDYSQNGYYFITICTRGKECLFGEIVNGGMVLNDFGKIAFHELHKTSEIRKNMKIDYFVIMPNHLHAIVVIDNPIVVGAYCNMPLRDEQNKCQSPSNNLGSMVCGYKSTLTKQINELRKTPQQRIWQRNYHEHIIRNEKSLKMIREYILNNPQKWENDKFFIS